MTVPSEDINQQSETAKGVQFSEEQELSVQNEVKPSQDQPEGQQEVDISKAKTDEEEKIETSDKKESKAEPGKDDKKKVKVVKKVKKAKGGPEKGSVSQTEAPITLDSAEEPISARASEDANEMLPVEKEDKPSVIGVEENVPEAAEPEQPAELASSVAKDAPEHFQGEEEQQERKVTEEADVKEEPLLPADNIDGQDKEPQISSIPHSTGDLDETGV